MIRHGSYPRKRKIKNIIKSVKKEVRHSKIDQQNVMAHTEKWGGNASIYFMPKYVDIEKCFFYSILFYSAFLKYLLWCFSRSIIVATSVSFSP